MDDRGAETVVTAPPAPLKTQRRIPGEQGTWVFLLGDMLVTVATFVDRNDPPTFPRWFGYFNIWFVLLSMPGSLVVVFNDGPLAWNGVFAFWIPLGALVGWIVTVAVVMLHSIGAEEAATAPPAAHP